MAVTLQCRCGRSYKLKDELAGKRVQCPHCAATIEVPAAAQGAPVAAPLPQADPAFDRDTFLLRQKHLSISEKYFVWDDAGKVILFIERPSHVLRSLAAIFGGVLAGIFVGFGLAGLAALMPGETLPGIVAIIPVLVWFVVVIAVIVALYPKRHVTFYRDESRQERLLEILQDQKMAFLVATFTVNDPNGQLLGRLRKNHLSNIFRKRWWCLAPDGSVLCVAKEDSVILALLRRFLGPLFGLLRTNFLICAGETEQVIGEFNRKFTILDRYALDMKADPRRTLDRRIALALGVMLDTGERR